MPLFLNDDFQNLDMGEVCPLTLSQSDENMLLNILIHRPIHNVAEPILLTVLERQLKQQVSTRGHLREVWVGVCLRGLQTLTLFKTRDLYYCLCSAFFCLPCFSFPIKKVFFLYK